MSPVAAFATESDEDEQHPKSRSRDDEKVDRYKISNMLI
jgi:hypothetical protein